jgi:hypothetical protein
MTLLNIVYRCCSKRNARAERIILSVLRKSDAGAGQVDCTGQEENCLKTEKVRRLFRTAYSKSAVAFIAFSPMRELFHNARTAARVF